MRRKLTTHEPRKRTNCAVVDEDVQCGESDHNPPSCPGAWAFGVDDGVNKLAASAENETAGQEYSSSTIWGNDDEVNQDSSDADCDENAAVFECVANACHFEEIGTVCCRAMVSFFN